MEEKNEVFLLKEFLVGLVVLVVFFIFLLWGLNNILDSIKPASLLSSLFASKEKDKIQIVEEPDYCSFYPILKSLPAEKLEFTRKIERLGWPETRLKYFLQYNTSKKNQIFYQIEGELLDIPYEQNTIYCNKKGLVYDLLDNLLIAGLLNTPPQKVKDFAVFQVLNKENYLLPFFQDASNKKEWQRYLSLKGILSPYASQPNLEKGNCFFLDASATVSSYNLAKIQLSDKEINTYQIESFWTATASALLAQINSKEECLNSNQSYDNQATIKIKETIWFAPESGMVKRQILPLELFGQPSFLPNGYLPLTITDEQVVK